jgi:ankyrin repeat protein
MSAALGGRVDVLRRLIEHGAGAGGVNLDQQDADGCTALWWACCLGHAEAAQLLMDRGARRDLTSDWGVSPLEVAVRAGRRECVRLFQVGRHDEKTFAWPS